MELLIFFGVAVAVLFQSAVPVASNSLTRDKRAEEACFCDEVLGCFYNNDPWSSATRPVPCPWSPEQVGAKFLLYTRNSSEPYNITLRPAIVIAGSDYDPSKKTVIIVHGYNGLKFYEWMYNLKRVLLEKGDVNVIVLDWSQGSGKAMSEYLQAVANLRVVAAELAKVLSELVQCGQSPDDIHLIGHSLGAHVCGLAAKYLKKLGLVIGLLTGLDVAQPMFEDYSKKVQAAKGDVKLFIALHTDAVYFIPCLGFGYVKALADIDLYMNGGRNQPGCSYADSFANIFTSIKSIADIGKIPEDVQKSRACSHKKVTDYYIAAVERDDCMIGKLISDSSLTSINSMVCANAIPVKSNVTSCTEQTCVSVGTWTTNITARGSFLVKTHADPPYCISGEHKRSVTGSSDDGIWETLTSPFRTWIQRLLKF